MTWQPIDAAKSGQRYIVYAHGHVLTATKTGTRWMRRGEEIFPTHWMHLPAEPTGETP
jgi:hypothetical protein